MSRRVADPFQPGKTGPVSTETRSIKTSTTSSKLSQPHRQLPPSTNYEFPSPTTASRPQSANSLGWSELQLAPATRTSVVTTTTTTTVHFAPILVPRTKPIRPSYSSFSGPSGRPPLTPQTSFASFMESEERRASGSATTGPNEDALRLDPKLYPLSQTGWPGGVKRFRMELGALEGTFYEDARLAAFEIGQESSSLVGTVGGGASDDPTVNGGRDKGKGKASDYDQLNSSALLSRNERGPLHARRTSRRPRTRDGSISMGGVGATGHHPDLLEEEEDESNMNLDDGEFGPKLRPSPGPPRKRRRASTHSLQPHEPRSSSVESDAGHGLTTAAATTTTTTTTTLGLGGDGQQSRSQSTSPQFSTLPLHPVANAATLPSPNLSPPSPVPTFAGDDDKDRSSSEDEEEEHASERAGPLHDAEQQFDLGSGTALSGLLSLPDFVNMFDQLSPALQSYFIFAFLKRSSIPVLQTINNIIAPALRRDFLTDLPPELSVHILGFLDAKALCRASVVCQGWRRLVDGEWRVWKERLVRDELWVGDGSEEKEAREIAGGKKENLFLKRWKAGVWDEESGSTWSGKLIDEAMHIDGIGPPPTRRFSHVKLASPSSSREASPFPPGHYTHPFKALYRRRFETRRNWAEKTPKRVTFACNANNVVTCLQFDKDKIVSASDDHSINVFDTSSGAVKARLSGHDGGVWALQYIGNVLVSGSTDRTVRIWDLDEAKCTHTFVGHTSTVRCLQIVEPENINPDPTGDPIWEPPYPLIVTGSRDWSLRVWKLPAPGKDKEYHPIVPQSPTEENTDPSDNPFHLRHLAGHRHAVRALAAHGRTLVSGSYDCHVRVWDILTGECKHKLSGHSQKVYSVVFDHRRQQCASGSMDGTVRLWSTATGESLATLEGHSSLVGLLGLSFRHLVSAAADSTLRIWDPTTGDCRHTLAAHSGAITCFQHDEYKVVSGSDGTLKMWDVRDGSFTRDLLTGLTGVWQVSFDQRFCVAAVQRNGQSEFEILDFGPVDYEDVVEEREAEEEEERKREERERGGGGRDGRGGTGSAGLRDVKTEEMSEEEELLRIGEVEDGGGGRTGGQASTSRLQARPNRPPPTVLPPSEFPRASTSTGSNVNTTTPTGASTSTSSTSSRVPGILRRVALGSAAAARTPESYRLPPPPAREGAVDEEEEEEEEEDGEDEEMDFEGEEVDGDGTW